jgi:S1-C subfamily serine protease
MEPGKSLVAPLGIFGIDLDDTTAEPVSGLRTPSGVIVVGRVRDGEEVNETGLISGDAIHRINGIAVTSVDGLRSVLDQLKIGSAVALPIERNRQLMFLAFPLQ